MRVVLLLFTFCSAGSVYCTEVIPSSRVPSVDVAYFGDSQLWYTFRGIEDFHANINQYCRGNQDINPRKQPLPYAGIGISHSRIDDWVERNVKPSNSTPLLCGAKDGRVFGELNNEVKTTEYQYWQRLCQPNKSGFDAILDMKPKVVVGMFLGGHTGYNFEEKTTKAFQKFMQTVPSDMGCVVITSPPLLDIEKVPLKIQQRDRAHTTKNGKPYEKRKKNNQDWRAHRKKVADFIHKLVRDSKRCELVAGHDKAEIALNYENYNHASSYPDPYPLILDTHHLSEAGGKKFFELIRSDLCASLGRALKGAREKTEVDGPEEFVPAAQ